MQIFGYFNSPHQEQPEFDPGMDVVCPFCLLPLAQPIRTTSLMKDGDTRSYFYRAHRACAEQATDEEIAQIESSLIDSAGKEGAK